MSISEFARQQYEKAEEELSNPPVGLADWIVEAQDADYIVEAHTAYEAAKKCCVSFARPTRVLMARDHEAYNKVIVDRFNRKEEVWKEEEKALKDIRNLRTTSEESLESLIGLPASTMNLELPSSPAEGLDAPSVATLRILLLSGMDSEKAEVTLSVLSRHMTEEEYLSLWR